MQNSGYGFSLFVQPLHVNSAIDSVLNAPDFVDLCELLQSLPSNVLDGYSFGDV